MTWPLIMSISAIVLIYLAAGILTLMIVVDGDPEMMESAPKWKLGAIILGWLPLWVISLSMWLWDLWQVPRVRDTREKEGGE